MSRWAIEFTVTEFLGVLIPLACQTSQFFSSARPIPVSSEIIETDVSLLIKSLSRFRRYWKCREGKVEVLAKTKKQKQKQNKPTKTNKQTNKKDPKKKKKKKKKAKQTQVCFFLFPLRRSEKSREKCGRKFRMLRIKVWGALRCFLWKKCYAHPLRFNCLNKYGRKTFFKRINSWVSSFFDQILFTYLQIYECIDSV